MIRKKIVKPRKCRTSLWKHADGRLQILQLIQSQMPQADTSQLTLDWWNETKPSASTSLPLRCNTCYHSGHIKLEKVVSGRKQFACACNGKMTWDCEAGRQRLLRQISESPHLQRIDVSLITESYWKEVKPSCNTCPPLRCQECNYVSDSSAIKDLRRQGVSCYCLDRRNPPWKSITSFNYIKTLLNETCPDIDSATISEDWWREREDIHAQTSLPLQCRKCGEECSARISTLLKKKEIFCKCARKKRSIQGILARISRKSLSSGEVKNEDISPLPSSHQVEADKDIHNFRWSSAEGFHRIKYILQEKYPSWDSSSIDLNWWSLSKATVNTKLLLICKDCGFEGRAVRISRIQQSQIIPCVCQGSVRWVTAEGLTKYEAFCASFQDKVDFEKLSLIEWKLNIKGIESEVECTCKECGLQSRIKLHALQTAARRGMNTPLVCWCSCTSLKWASKAGFQRFHEIVLSLHHIDSSDVTWKWWEEAVSSYGRKATPPIRCKICGYNAITTLNSIQQGSGIGCWCNRGALWRSEDGYNRFSSFFKEHKRLSTRITLEWWMKSDIRLETPIEMVCNYCETSGYTSLHALLQGQGIRCRCYCKTEKKLENHLLENYKNMIIRCQPPACHNHLTGRCMRFDFSVGNCQSDAVAYVELDGGIGHFGQNWKKEVDEESPKRDLLKETWALRHGCSVIRLLQSDVYKNVYDWQGYLRKSLDQALHLRAQGLSPKVFTPLGAKEYCSGIYASLRPQSQRQLG